MDFLRKWTLQNLAFPFLPSSFLKYGTTSRIYGIDGGSNILMWKPINPISVPPHLIDVVVGGNGVETCVEVVEQVDHLERRAGGRQRGEAHDVAEVDGHRFERLGYHRLALNQVVGHGPAKGRRENGNTLLTNLQRGFDLYWSRSCPG